MSDYTISGQYTLPSLGKVYNGKEVNPNITIRAMTVEEEMRRLNPSERPYKTMASIIDDCLVDKPGISAYDMCMGDYQFLLHRLRVVTYGNDYKITTICPYCGTQNTDTIKLNDMEVFTYNKDIAKYFDIVLPLSGKHIHLKMQTPRILDDITIQVKELKKKSPTMSGDPAFLFNLESLIDTVDGEHYDTVQLQSWLRKLPMGDANFILQCSQKLNDKIGLNLNLSNTCNTCTLEYKTKFRSTNEFFRPNLDT